MLIVASDGAATTAASGERAAGPRERTRFFIDAWGRKLHMPSHAQLSAMRPLLTTDFAAAIKLAREDQDAFMAAEPDMKPGLTEITFAGVEDNNFDTYAFGHSGAIDARRHGVVVIFRQTYAGDTYRAWRRYVWVREDGAWRLDDVIDFGDRPHERGSSLKALFRSVEGASK
ncbi:MAG: hypothetical protein E6Q88_11465 [Lysobacteraceae bacterium]|nr:MAG: hypothetical protein E6Q88_11465 [Xanthomonadaceae bacterium]